ncbi:hypothetical protein [Streptomyces adustus]
MHQIVNQSGGSLTAAAESIGLNKQSLGRLLHCAQPPQHIIQSVVRYCIGRIGGQDQHGWLDEVNRLWTQAQAAHPLTQEEKAPRPHASVLGAAVDPGFIEQLLHLLIEGEHELIAMQLVTAYPNGVGAGKVLEEIGRRSPGGAAAVVDAVAEQAGQDVAAASMESLAENAAEVASAVRRLLPPPPKPPEVSHPVTSAAVSVADLDPLVFDGRRLSRLIRRGDPAQAASEILAQATAEPNIDAEGRPVRHASIARAVAELELGYERVNIRQAARLLLSLRQGDADDPRTFALVLGQLVLRDHTELTAVVLHQLACDDAALATAVLDSMNRPHLLKVLEATNTPTRHMSAGITEALLTHVPARATADFLLAAALGSDSVREAADMMSRLQDCTAVLHRMAAIDHQQTARILNALAQNWTLTGDAPERRIAQAFLSLARTDTRPAARVLLQLLRLNTGSAADLLFLMETGLADSDATQVAAKALAATLDIDRGTASVLIVHMACREDFPIRLLERVAVENRSHATLIAARMVAQNLTYFRSQIPLMIRQQATTLVGELLLQLETQEPNAPWKLIRQALSAGAVPAALANADAYIAGI